MKIDNEVQRLVITKRAASRGLFVVVLMPQVWIAHPWLPICLSGPGDLAFRSIAGMMVFLIKIPVMLFNLLPLLLCQLLIAVLPRNAEVGDFGSRGCIG